jgi:uncharacterized membrane protein YkvA (DUF1232 family)
VFRIQGFKDRVRMLKRDSIVLYLVARDPRTPWYVRVLAGAVAAYALSPFDLIPDFIPVLGYLDDLILVPAGIALVLRLVPAEVMSDCREKATARLEQPISRGGAAAMIGIWLAAATCALLLVLALVMHVKL